MKKQTKENILVVVAVICFLLFAVMLYKGYDKMTNYNNPESVLLESKNAYVGGDAYNYIINGTYSTAYFVLAMGFLISGIICVIGYMFLSEEKLFLNKMLVSNLYTAIDEEDKLPPL